MTDYSAAFDFSALPVVDNHLHPYVISHDRKRYAPLNSFLGMPGEDEAALAHRDAMLYQRWATRQLAAFLECDADPERVAAARAKQNDERAWAQRLFRDQNIEALVVDTGYPQPPLDMTDYRAITPAEVLTIYRIEPPIKAMLDDGVGWDEFVRRFDEGIARAIHDEGFLGLKSIIAYRTGLEIDIGHESDDAGQVGLTRACNTPDDMMASKPLRDHLLLRALRLAVDLNVPFQIHTGIGDRDIVLERCNPALLNPVLKREPYRDAKVILIHTYPYVAEASWMAAALPNVWMDLSEGVPFALAAVDRIFATALELAPINRILYGSDAFAGPEQIWLGAKIAKAALARVFGDLLAKDLVTEDEARDAARAILAGNARVLYGVLG
ncbi:MAG: amidohydrolase family protein [Chloroflexia bacterium]|nr:amidohydrolase family protein [Chloroflexia bacterium]